jgi:hypothetical protein
MGANLSQERPGNRRSRGKRRNLLPALLLSLGVHALLLAGLLLGGADSSPVPKAHNPEMQCRIAEDMEQGEEPQERVGPMRASAGPRTHVFDVTLVEVPAPAPPSPSEKANPTSPGPRPLPGAAPGSGPAGLSSGGDGQGTGGQRLFPPIQPGQNVVYLLDRSQSMGLRKSLVRACNEVLLSLKGLPATSRFQVLIFNRQVETLLPAATPAWLQADPATLQSVRQVLQTLTPTGSTQHGQALQRALVWRPQQIVLATDSDDLSLAEIQALTRCNAGRSAIHVIDLGWRGEREGSLVLRQLAGSNRGSYRQTAPTPQGMRAGR